MTNDANGVLVIGGRTNRVIAKIPVGQGPQGVAANPKTGTVFVTNHFDLTMSAINGRTNAVTAAIPIGGDPAALVNPSDAKIYVANFDGTVTVLGTCPPPS